MTSAASLPRSSLPDTEGSRPRLANVRDMRARPVSVVAVLLIIGASACSSDSAGSAESTVAETTTAPATTAPATTAPTTTTTSTVPEVRPKTVTDLLALERPIVLAHAGGEDEFPHSTPYAFAQSAAAGVDMLDMDVLLTADGVLIVQHDDTIDRTTESTGNIADMTYAQLEQLDNAYWFTDTCVCKDQPESAYKYRGIRTGATPAPDGATPEDFVIPRFRDIVERFPDFPLNIEIKGNGAAANAAADQLVKELTELGKLDAAVVTSFDDTVVAHVKEIAPSIELTPGLDLSTKWVLDGTPLPTGMRILQVPIEYSGIQVITPELITNSHAAGYVIWVWPNDRRVENADGYRSLLEQGLDGLNINYPATGVQAVADFIGS